MSRMSSMLGWSIYTAFQRRLWWEDCDERPLIIEHLSFTSSSPHLLKKSRPMNYPLNFWFTRRNGRITCSPGEIKGSLCSHLLEEPHPPPHPLFLSFPLIRSPFSHSVSSRRDLDHRPAEQRRLMQTMMRIHNKAEHRLTRKRQDSRDRITYSIKKSGVFTRKKRGAQEKEGERQIFSCPFFQ